MPGRPSQTVCEPEKNMHPFMVLRSFPSKP